MGLAKNPVYFDKPGISGFGYDLSFGLGMQEADPKKVIALVPTAAGGYFD